ncbi:MAG: pyrroline-5-carboxylate reductase [Crocinitomicaceae bacterium]|nr:pyrroline-5-carboxylate reductase [Crocinitomicaceae bacterium]|tara:strand:- start:15295 stop:16077 length:783 start_codon:yes stop_codon:yes gene_type:complete
MKIGIVGCGNLGLSILNGIVNESPNNQIYASRRNIDSIRSLASDTVKITTDNSELIKNSNIIILALKPYNILPFIKEHNELFKSSQHTIVSVATGIEIEEIKNEMTEDVGVYRAMPNTATSVNESMTAISGSEDVLNRGVEVSSIFETLGEVVVIDESLMDAATILGACGVAYVLRFMRAMIQGGIQVGFDAKTATKIVSQTMKGASELIIQNGTHPEEEIDKVTTPKGCTIIGLNEMEHAGFSSALIKGIVTSYEKIES